jgi:hypothetical protein
MKAMTLLSRLTSNHQNDNPQFRRNKPTNITAGLRGTFDRGDWLLRRKLEFRPGLRKTF